MLSDSSINNSEQTCFVVNCATCLKNNKCIQCKNNFTLVENKCLKDTCSIFGKCKYCTEYDCIHCQEGYELDYGFCVQTEDKIRLEILLGLVLPLGLIIFLAFIIFFIQRRRKKMAAEKVISANILGKKRPKNGQYIIINSTNIQNIGTINIATSNSSHSLNTEISPKESMNGSSLFSNVCVFCNSKNIYSFAQCGCGLCKEHISEDNKIECPIHGVSIIGNIVIKKNRKSIVRIKEEDKITGEHEVKMCPVCKIMKGTVSFNCGCPVLLCNKCFNDNVFVFKFNKCPGCNKPYSFEGREMLFLPSSPNQEEQTLKY